MKKIIAFSLWGDNPKYTIGALKNARLAKVIYPGWICRFYCGKSTPLNIIQELISLGSEVVRMEEEGNWSGMFWRFNPIAENDVEMMISRDTDSRLTFREKFAVDEWIKSNKLFHIMRDHPYHGTEILGGMWGARKPILQDIKHLMNIYEKSDFYQVDQNFLREIIYPRINYSVCVHDPFFQKVDFPLKRIGLEFVGQVFDENDITVQEHIDILSKNI